MIIRPSIFGTLPAVVAPISKSTQIRCLHARVSHSRIPDPTPFVPNTITFLTLIGRNLSQHASKIPSWEALFSLTSSQLRELGIDPPRSRRYLLRWREKFRKGQFGIGGDAKSVVDGVASMRVVEVPTANSDGSGLRGVATATKSAGMRKIVVNAASGTAESELPIKELLPIKGLTIKRAATITGPGVLPAQGGKGFAKIVVREGLWEDKRGHKIDGGERRMAEVRAKRRSEERNTTR